MPLFTSLLHTASISDRLQDVASFSTPRFFRAWLFAALRPDRGSPGPDFRRVRLILQTLNSFQNARLNL